MKAMCENSNELSQKNVKMATLKLTQTIVFLQTIIITILFATVTRLLPLTSYVQSVQNVFIINY